MYMMKVCSRLLTQFHCYNLEVLNVKTRLQKRVKIKIARMFFNLSVIHFR